MEKVKKKQNDEVVTKKLIELGNDVVGQLGKKQNPSVSLPIRALSNIIFDGQEEGIESAGGAGNNFNRNLIYNNSWYGVYIYGASTGVQVINNTICGSGTQDGVRWEGTSGGEMYNNIIQTIEEEWTNFLNKL